MNLSMTLYMLAPKGEYWPDQMFNPLGGGKVIRVHGDDWLQARICALYDAQSSGVDCAVILCNHTRIVTRDRQTLKPMLANNMYAQHGLWLHMARLLCNRYRHVYLPPVSGWQASKPIPLCGATNTPVPASLCGYHVPTVAEVGYDVDNLGETLVSAGYDNYVLGDYAYETVSGVHRFKEPGTTNYWRRSYERATHRITR